MSKRFSVTSDAIHKNHFRGIVGRTGQIHLHKEELVWFCRVLR
jgi:hypothetical protein